MKNVEKRYEVAKAGGWSLAIKERIDPLLDYLRANSEIRYFVPSAPGAVNDGEFKVTDLLIGCSPEGGSNQEFNRVQRQVRQRYGSIGAIFDEVSARYTSIGNELGYYGFQAILDRVAYIVAASKKSESELDKARYQQLIPSRGEWLNGHMWAELLDFRFVDPTELIRFRKDGRLDERSYAQIASRLKGNDRSVIPGFYGLGADGEVQTFPRDGSDVTGAVIARGVNASKYQNLTSADGVFSADPRIVANARLIDKLTFEEYREFGNGGIKVLHRDTIVSVARVGIPINVRHSLKPESAGTMVVSERSDQQGRDVIGVTGRGGLVSLNIHKFGMNEEKGIVDRVLNGIRRAGISIEHAPSENDRLSVVFREGQLSPDTLNRMIDKIARGINPGSIGAQDNIGFISVVGQGIRENRGRVTKELFSALDDASIRHEGVTNALSGISIIVFIEGDRVNDAIKVAHEALVVR